MATWSDESVLKSLGYDDALLLGEGGEARVFAINQSQVLRLVRPGGDINSEQMRVDLLAEVAAGRSGVPFETPEVLKILSVGERIAIVEKRLPGAPLAEILKIAQGAERHGLVLSYLNAAAAIGDINVARDYWGDLVASSAVRCPKYREYLRDKLSSIRPRAGDLQGLIMRDPEALPDCSTPSLVHFDVFPANVLVEDGQVTAVIDFGASSMMADRRLDAWSAVAYLDAEISPSANDDDRRLAQQWLEARGLSEDYSDARRWIASRWCFAHDDPTIRAWCSRVLAS